MARTEGTGFLAYARTALRRFWKDTIHFGREQVIGLILYCLIFLFQWHYGLISKSNFSQNLKILAYPYLIIVCLIVFWHAVRAPWKIDREQQIQVQKTENAHRTEVNFLSERIDLLKQELQTEKEKQGLPNIVPEILEAHVGTNWGTTPWEFECAIAVRLSLVNKSSSVTIKGYRLSIDFPSTEHFSTDRRTLDYSYWRLCKEERVSRNGTRYIDRRLEPHLDSAIGKQALDRGQAIEGWLIFLVDGVNIVDYRAASVSVTVVDAFGGNHLSEKAHISQPSALIETAA